MGDQYIVNVEAAVVNNGRFLMIVRGAAESHAPGTLSLPGGTVEGSGGSDDILEQTLHRELQEEVGIAVDEPIVYIESKAFISDQGEPVIDVVFLCRHSSGEPAPGDPGEVAELRWMRAGEVLADPNTPPWTRRSIELAERRRQQLGW